jgi:Ca2+-binding EF-hand superfamily protein
MVCRFEDTPFASRVFTLFDYDGSGQIDFGEFVSVLWNFCTFTRYGLLALAFNLYDTDGSGTLSVAEIEEIIRQVYGLTGVIRDEKLVMALLAMSGDKVVRRDAEVTRTAFEAFAVEHPSVLEPALDLQTEVRNAAG